MTAEHDSTTYNVYAFAGNSEMLRGENLSEQAAKECYFQLLEEGYPSNYIIVKPPHPYIPSN